MPAALEICTSEAMNAAESLLLMRKQEPVRGLDNSTSNQIQPINNELDFPAQVKVLKDSIEILERKLKCQVESNLSAKRRITFLEKKEFSIRTICKNHKVFSSYTGLPNFETFTALLKFFKSKAEKLKYWRGKHTTTERKYQISVDSKKPGDVRSLNIQEELFMVLYRLRQGTYIIEVARLFGVTEAYISRTFLTWLNFLYFEFKELFGLPVKSAIRQATPSQYSDYPNTTIIIDCTEIRIERPSSLQRQKETFSSYKHFNTGKILIGITPGNLVCLVSKVYGGGCSDKHITKESGLYNMLLPGDEIMADKGFEIDEDLPHGVKLNIPPKFMKSVAPQMPENDVLKTRKIAGVRGNVERAIRRMKTFNILSGAIPLSMARSADQIVSVCAYLTNFQPALLKDKT